MPPSSRELTVREHERRECSLPAHLNVAPASARGITLSQTALQTELGVPAQLVDISRGGVGLRTTVFFPKTCHLALRVTLPAPGGQPAKTGPAGHAFFQATVRVQRVTMLGREPTYYLGAAFTEAVDVSRLLAACDPAGAPGPAKGPSATGEAACA